MTSHKIRQTFLSGLSGNDFTNQENTILQWHMAASKYSLNTKATELVTILSDDQF